MYVRSILVLVSLIASTSLADNWPNWRGPTGDGVASGTGYATSWNAEQNILWKVRLPGVGGSTPAVWGDKIFVTAPSGSSETEKNLVMCFNRRGERLWQKELGSERQGKHKKGSGSNPSPVTDGKYVYCYYKSGDLACLDFNGNVVWQKNLQAEVGEDPLWWDLGTSPVLTDSAVVVACVQSGPSYVAAFDKKSGVLKTEEFKVLAENDLDDRVVATPVFTDGKILLRAASHCIVK